MSRPAHRAPTSPATTRRLRRAVAATAAFSAGVVSLGPASAAELVTAELVAPQNVVEVRQGESAPFTITLSATGQAQCGSTSTARVKTGFSIAADGTVGSGSTFSSSVPFSAPGSGGNCAITGGGTATASVSAASSTPLGSYTVSLSPAAGTTQLTNSNANGGKLEDLTATTLTFVVVPPPNSAPVSQNAPSNAVGVEGSPLQTAGSFTDVDNNLTSITASAGTITPATGANGKLTGAWSWTLATTDQVSGGVTVTATDAAHATATQTFTYSAVNVDPHVSAPPSNAAGLEGDTLATTGAFSDVPADPLSITKSSGEGTVTDNGDGTWSWSLPTTDETSGTVVVSASDGDGGTQTASFTYGAANVAPGIATDAGDVTGNEGSPLTNAGAFSDVAADVLSLSKTGDGTLTPGSANGAWSWSHPATDDDGGTVSVTADDGLATTTDSFDYTVRNVAPYVQQSANDASGNEGTELTTSGTFADVADPVTIAQVSGPGQVTDLGGGSWAWSLDSTDDLTGTVVVRATDGDGGSVDDTFAVSVLNLAPVVAGSVADATGSEGTTLLTGGTFSDVAADTLTITATGAGTLVDNGDGSWSWSLAAADQTSGTVTVTARDDDGGVTALDFDYSAVDVAPQLVRAAADATGNEGQTLTTGGEFGDVAADAITVSKVSGPGTVTNLGGGRWSYSLATTDQLSDTVVVQARDKDGITGPTDTFAVTAANIAPAVGVAPTSQTGQEGSTLAAGGSFTDVVADPITISKDSGAGTVTDNGDGTWSWSLGTTDNGGGTVVVRADDGDGGITTSAFTYTATNVVPTLSTLALTGNSGTACLTGNVVGLRFTVSDPGSADTMAGTINWGDGQTSGFTGRSVDTTHSYAPGVYAITVNVSDDDAGAATPGTASVNRVYTLGALGSPYNADGSSVFKYGSVAPLKVRITDCSNAPVAGLAPTVKVTQVSSATPSVAVNETVLSVSSADTTGLLRYDAAAGQYIYNLSTRSLSDGDARYTVTVALSATQRVSQGFGLRTK